MSILLHWRKIAQLLVPSKKHLQIHLLYLKKILMRNIFLFSNIKHCLNSKALSIFISEEQTILNTQILLHLEIRNSLILSYDLKQYIKIFREICFVQGNNCPFHKKLQINSFDAKLMIIATYCLIFYAA